MATRKAGQAKSVKVATRYNKATVSGWQYTNKSALDIINEYQKKIKNGEWMSSEDRTRYKSAIDDYTATGNSLRKASGKRYTSQEEKSWQDSLSSLSGGYDWLESTHSKYTNADDYKKAYTKAKEQQKLWEEYMNYDAAAGQAEMDRLAGEIDSHWKSIQPGIQQTKDYIAKLEKEYDDVFIYASAGHKPSQERAKELKQMIDNAYATIADAEGQNTAMKNSLAAKKEYHATATKYQDINRIMTDANNMLNSTDLEKYADIGTNSPDSVMSNANGYDKTYGNMALDAWKTAIGGGGMNFDETSELFGDYDQKEIYDLINKHATDKEKAVYNAYLGMGDTAKADEYMTYLLDTYRQKEAGEYTAKYDQTALELAFSLGAGFDSGMMGLVNAGLGLAGKDPIQHTSTNQYATGTMRENNGFVWGIANDLAMNIGNQIPSMAVGALNPTAGAIALGLSAGGNKYAETIARGYGKEEALGVAASVGTLEAVLGRMLGGISKYGGISQWTDDIIQGISKAGWRLAADLGIKFTGETIEEGLQAVLEPYLNNAFLGTNEKVNWEEVGYSALLGGLSAGVLEGVPMGVNTAIDAISNRVDTINKYSAQPAELVAKVLEIDPENQVALKAQEKIGAGEKVSKGDILSMAKVVELQPATTKAPTATPVQTVEEKPSPAMKENPVTVTAKDSKGKTVKGEIRGIQVNGGKVSYNLSDGSTVRADKVSFTTENEALVAKIAAERAAQGDGFTTEAAMAMMKGYDGSVGVSDYVTTFNEAMKLGAEGGDIQSAVSLGESRGIDNGLVYAAYVIGQKNSQSVLKFGGNNAITNTESEGFTNESNNAEGIHLRDGGERNGGTNSEGQVSSVESGAGKTATWREGSRVADSEASRLIDEGRRVKVSNLGISGGSTERTVVLLDKQNETAAMKKGREILESDGMTVRYFAGDNLLYTDKYGNEVEARAFVLGNQVFIRADHPLYTADQLARHEDGHGLLNKLSEADRKKVLNDVRKRLVSIVGKENIDAVAKHYAEAYEGTDYNADEIWEECICDSLGDMNIFSKQVARELMAELLPEIKSVADNTIRERTDNQTRGSPASTEGKASREAALKQSYTSPEEAKMSGDISDAKFSIEFAPKIAENQRKTVENGTSMISSEMLEKAISDTAYMVEQMKPYANILPQDKVGKTLVKNGSYDVSVENTTVCIRTLAYNSFVDMVSEKIGRPLTQMESFLVSQKLYEIAKEPQCLYCYVSLDRKAFNEMVIRYAEQRDDAISAYEDAGRPKLPASFNAEWPLFKEFLDGRKPTKNMWDRYTSWIKTYNNGERLVSLSDISTEQKRLDLVENGGAMASQVKDILKYAQSASWAKKQTQYVAYFDEILKLKPSVIKNLNSHYGMRWYSFSDYSGAFIVENMQQITDAAIRGLKGLSYTKDTDFAEIFAPTGMNINISVYAQKTEGGYAIDPKQSANIDEAIKLRGKYPNVGIVVVATDKGGVEWALAQDWSDVVIPFHTVRTGADVAEFYNWEIFNSEQNDTVSDQNLWDEYVKSVGKKKVSKMVYPSEHQNDLDTYLEICKERGLTPRFKSFIDNPNYMKLVNETRQSELETKPLKPDFDVDAAERSFNKFVDKGGYYEGWYNDGIDVDSEADIVASDVLAGKKANEVSYGRQDVDYEALKKSRRKTRTHGKASRELDLEYLAAVERGDMETAQRMVDEAAREAGYNSPKLYHGTNAFGFTEADVSKSDDGISFFAVDSEETASTYSGGQKVKRIVDASKGIADEDIETIQHDIADLSTDLAYYCSRTLGIQGWVDYDYFSTKLEECFDELEKGGSSADAIEDFMGFCDELFYSFLDNYYDGNYENNPWLDEDEKITWDAFEGSEEADKLADEFYSYVNQITSKFKTLDLSSRAGIYELYANTGNHMVIEGNGRKWNNLVADNLPDIKSPEYEKYGYRGHRYEWTTRSVAAYAKDLGYSGVTFKDIIDSGDGSYISPATVYIFFKPQEQVKSADPVTYDDNGNVIPLSERFNSQNPDIRFSRELDFIDYLNEEVDDDLARAHSEADESMMNRLHLINALESITDYPSERGVLNDYRAMVETIAGSEKRIADIDADIKALSKNAEANAQVIKMLKAEKNTLENQIHKADERLLSLESTKALKGVLERERTKAYKSAKQEGYEALKAQRAKSDAKLEALRDYYRGKLDEKRIKANEKLDATVKRYQEARAKGIEGRRKSEAREKIKNLKQKFQNMIEHPTERVYVPRALISAMVDVCDIIDTSSPLYKADGSINKAQQARNEARDRLIKLRDEYNKIKSDSDAMIAQEYDEEIAAYLDELRQNYEGKNITDMTLDELNELYHTMRSIDETLQDARKLIGEGESEDVYEVGDDIADEQSKIAAKRKNGKRSAFDKANDAAANLTLSPIRAALKMAGYDENSQLYKMMRDIEKGVRVKTKFVMDANKSFEKLTTGKNSKKYESAVYEAYGKELVDNAGRKFKVSKMQMMQAVMSYERELANDKLKHVSTGGFTFADLDMLNKGKLRQSISAENAHTVNFGTELAMQFTQELANDTWAQEYMETARKFFDETAKKAINDANMKLKHRIIATGSKYIPYEVDQNFVVKEITAENDIQQVISSYGMLKDIKQGAAQPIIITGLNNILDRHIDQVGNVHGLAIPIRNFNKVWNVKTYDGNTVKQIIDQHWGKGGVDIITQAVKDVQGSRVKSNNPASDLYRKVKGGVITATFTLNGSVVSKQIGSMYAATSMLNYRDPATMTANLIYTMTHYDEIAAEVDKYTASAWIRRQGLSDAELHTLMTEAKKSKLGRFASKLPTAINPSKWIAGMDSAVALSLWKYAKEDVAKRTGLQGEELMKAAAEFYDDVIEHTQSMSDALHRPEIQKGDNITSDLLGMFKTDLYQGAGQLRAAVGKLSANNTKENRVALAKAVVSSTSSICWGALMTSVFALVRYKVNPYRDDEDDEITAESWLKVAGSDVAAEMIGYMVPLLGGEVAGSIFGVMHGGGIDDVDSVVLTTVNDLIDAMTSVAKNLKDGEMPSAQFYINLISKFASIFGVPASNVVRLVEAIKLHAEDIANGEFLSFEAGLTKPNSQRLYNAYVEGDADKIEKASRHYEDEKAINSALRKELRENDARVQNIAMSELLGDYKASASLEKEIIDEGIFDKNEVIGQAIDAEINYVKDKLIEAKEYADKGKEDEAKAIYKALVKRGYTMEFINSYMESRSFIAAYNKKVK